MIKTEYVLYTDPEGKSHDALITALNGLHEGYATVIYVDAKAPESDNVKKIFDVPHTDIAPKLHARILKDDVAPVVVAASEDKKLAEFLMANFKNETGDETPVDCAIRLLSKRKAQTK